ncbi:MAG: hypothetical protein EBU08_06255 [Micrococcales bacterium]|nr:hypothetical protein [Micrococcales bacterium]
MKSIIEDTADILKGMGLEVNAVTTAPRFAGIVARLPNDSQVFFVWSEMDEGDFHFRVARFWQSENPFSMMAFEDLIAALVNLRILISS